MKMKTKMNAVTASVRFVVGDIVSWNSNSGNRYSGTVVGIKQGSGDDLIIVNIGNNQHRSFYDNATDWRMGAE